MKANKAIWAAATSGLGGLIALLTLALPYIPGKVGFGLLVVVLIGTPIVVYIVPNWDRVKSDAIKVIKDAKSGNVTAVVHDGSLFLKSDVLPAIASDSGVATEKYPVAAKAVAKVSEAADKITAAAEKVDNAVTQPIPAVTDRIIAETQRAIQTLAAGGVPTSAALSQGEAVVNAAASQVQTAVSGAIEGGINVVHSLQNAGTDVGYTAARQAEQALKTIALTPRSDHQAAYDLAARRALGL